MTKNLTNLFNWYLVIKNQTNRVIQLRHCWLFFANEWKWLVRIDGNSLSIDALQQAVVAEDDPEPFRSPERGKPGNTNLKSVSQILKQMTQDYRD